MVNIECGNANTVFQWPGFAERASSSAAGFGGDPAMGISVEEHVGISLHTAFTHSIEQGGKLYIYKITHKKYI